VAQKGGDSIPDELRSRIDLLRQLGGNIPSRKIPEIILPIDPDAPDVAANEQRGDDELEEVKRLILEKGSTPKQGRRNPK
jgi:hypothetical protein